MLLFEYMIDTAHFSFVAYTTSTSQIYKSDSLERCWLFFNKISNISWWHLATIRPTIKGYLLAQVSRQ